MNKTSSTPPQAQAEVDENNNKRNRSLEMVTDDLWFKIFLLLPFQSLLVSKSVSKSWLSIISSHRFVKSHLDRAEDAETLIVHHELDDDDDLELQGSGPFSLSHLGSGDSLEVYEFPYSESDYPFEPISCEILGSDCGIVCVLVYLFNCPALKKEFDIYLWNPATKLSKLVPQQDIFEGVLLRPVMGFGFDHIDFDFKVVKVVSRFFAEVYSSNRNAWRKIEPKLTDAHCCISHFHLCLHGFLLTPGCNGMMAFDLNKEVFNCNIKLPLHPLDTRITEYHDSIAVSTYDNSDKKVKLWTLDDEACLSGGGVEASWTIKLSCDVGVNFAFLAGLFNSVEFLLVDEESDWFFYNPNKEVPTALRGPVGCCEILKHTKSLFSVVGSKPVKWTSLSWSWKQQEESDSDVEMDEERILD